jgi:hypothetical protein
MAHNTSHSRHRAAESREEQAEPAPAAEGAPPPDGATGGTAADERLRRAEEMVDRAAERIGHYAGLVGHEILRFAARACEEAEDIWAEAQSLRRGERP